MVSCHAKYCPARGKNKIRLFRFPSDKARRAIWIDRCGKTFAKEYSKLCELHFDETQFEQRRLDGWRKLKPNAVPTIFPDITYLTPLNDQLHQKSDPLYDKNIKEIEPNYEEILIDSNVNEHMINNDSKIQATEPVEHSWIEVDNNDINRLAQKYQSDKQFADNEINRLRFELACEKGKNQLLEANNESLRKKNEFIEKELEEVNELSTKKTKLINYYKKKHKSLLDKFEKSEIFKRFAIGLTHQNPKWSNEHFKFAMQIRHAVGRKSYLYLKNNLGLPLPSYSTITRHMSEPSPASSRSKNFTRKSKEKIEASQHEFSFIKTEIETLENDNEIGMMD